MSNNNLREGLQLRTLMTDGGELQLSLERIKTAPPGPDEILVRLEGSPLNPSDIILLLGPADLSTLSVSGDGDDVKVTAQIPPPLRRLVAPRVGLSLPAGNEGAGVVIEAGEAVKALVGKTVAISGGAMYSQYRVVKAAEAVVVPDDTSPKEAASVFVNPLTALGMLGTMRLEGHTALVHTAAASNLGQMLVKLCLKDGVELVNIVRRPEQVALLKSLGAKHVVCSADPGFADDLTAAIIETGATIAFDAIGGGKLIGQILASMEVAAIRKSGVFGPYGSTTYKQVYVYGGLDNSPTELQRAFGMKWGIGGWLLTYFLERVGPEEAARLRARVAGELKTTFASHYAAEISLHEALQPDVITAFNRKTTGAKYVLNPNKGL
jgi:NADPH2:quinone reductase